MRTEFLSILLLIVAFSACRKNNGISNNNNIDTSNVVIDHRPIQVQTTNQDTINAIVARLPKNFLGMRTQKDLTHHHSGTDTVYNFNYTLTFHFDTVYHNTTVIEYAPQTVMFTENNDSITFSFPATIALPVSGRYVYYKLTDSLVWQVNDPGSEWIFRGKKM